MVRKNPEDPNSPLVGQGAFRVQVYLLSLLGADFAKMTKPQVLTASFIFDIISPFLVLFGVSLITKRNSEKVLREFYAAVHTPVIADHAESEGKTEQAKAVRAVIDEILARPEHKWGPALQMASP